MLIARPLAILIAPIFFESYVDSIAQKDKKNVKYCDFEVVK